MVYTALTLTANVLSAAMPGPADSLAAIVINATRKSPSEGIAAVFYFLLPFYLFISVVFFFVFLCCLSDIIDG